MAMVDIDLLSAAHIDDPFPVYRRLREDDPVHWSDQLQGWVLTRASDVATWLGDSRFSANRTHLFAKHQLRGLDPSIVADYLRLTPSMIVMKDGADHQRLRAQEEHTLCPAHVDAWAPSVRGIAERLVDDIIASGRGKLELVSEISEPFPALLMAELYRIPASDRERFHRWADDATAFFGVSPGDVEATARRANDGMLNLERYVARVIAERRESPGDDLVSTFIGAHGHGNISADELIANTVHMLIVGQMTSIAQFSNGIYELLKHPSELEKLRDQPALLPAAVDECIRFNPAVHFTHRIATTDIEIHGKVIQEGQIVFFGVASANRDPEMFSSPDEFDISRSAEAHMSFGAGPHRCVGSHLGRRELEAGYRALLSRMPNLRFDESDPPQRRANGLTFRGFSKLPLCY